MSAIVLFPVRRVMLGRPVGTCGGVRGAVRALGAPPNGCAVRTRTRDWLGGRSITILLRIIPFLIVLVVNYSGRIQAMDEAPKPLASTGFLLIQFAQIAAQLWNEKLKPYGIRTKHCGLLAVIAQSPGASQEQLSRSYNIVPSATVSILDDLEALGAVRRVPDPDNRRRYSIELTKSGHTLLAHCAEAARQVDDALLAPLSPSQRRALALALNWLGEGSGAPPANGDKRPGRSLAPGKSRDRRAPR